MNFHFFDKESKGGRICPGLPDPEAQIIRCLWVIGWFLLAAGTAALLLLRSGRFPFLRIPGGCLIRKVLHIYCPACGGTRAMMAFSQGEWVTALRWHPAIPMGFLWLLWFQFSHLAQGLSRGRLQIGLRLKPAWAIFFGGLFAANMILKNLGVLLLR